MPNYFVVSIPDGVVAEESLQQNANLDAELFERFASIHYTQADGVNVATETRVVYTARKAGTLDSLYVFPTAAPDGDFSYTVDMKKSTGAGAFASILSAVVTVNSSSTDRTLQTGTISTPTFVANDSFQVVVTAAGSSGNQGQGLCVTIHTKENAT
jgi:hypothetical protein